MKQRGRTVPIYFARDDFTCPGCGKPCKVVANLNDFDHEFDTHFPPDWGLPITECCEVLVDDSDLEDIVDDNY